MALSEQTTYRLLGGATALGVSGAGARVLPADPALAFFESGLRRHKAIEDLAADPAAFWEPEGGSGGGLLAHLASASPERLSALSDLLLIVNTADLERAVGFGGPGWGRGVVETLRGHFQTWCAHAGIRRRHPGRPLGVRLVADGSAPLGGVRLELKPGEFVTGLLPNHYSGPGANSRPLLAVHLNLPGEWPGYREVIRLYEDQDLLTLGNHWLDSYQHPALERPALYRLRYDPVEGLVHLLSPDLGPEWRLERFGDNGGPTVFGVFGPKNRAVAWLALGVLEEPRPAPAWVESEPTEDGEPEPPAQLSDAPLDAGGGLVRLEERGVLFQKVHFRDVMSGYEVQLGAGGAIGLHLPDPLATVRVTIDGVSLKVWKTGLSLEGVPLKAGAHIALSGSPNEQGCELEVDGVPMVWRDLSAPPTRAWPYLGELSRPPAELHLHAGAVHRIGRDASAGVRLPDARFNDNVLWNQQDDGSGVVMSQGGPVPRERFATDAILVAQRHADLDLSGDHPLLRSASERCCSWVRRAGRYLMVSRLERPLGPCEVELQEGDELLIGNSLFALHLQNPRERAAEVAVAATAEVEPAHPMPPPSPTADPERARAATQAPPVPLDPSAVDVDLLDDPRQGGAPPPPVGQILGHEQPEEADSLPLPQLRPRPTWSDLPPLPPLPSMDEAWDPFATADEPAMEAPSAPLSPISARESLDGPTVRVEKAPPATAPELAFDPFSPTFDPHGIDDLTDAPDPKWLRDQPTRKG